MHNENEQSKHAQNEENIDDSLRIKKLFMPYKTKCVVPLTNLSILLNFFQLFILTVNNLIKLGQPNQNHTMF